MFIQPDQPVVNRENPVDRNVTVVRNRFVVDSIERPVLWARSTQNILLTNNRIEVTKPGLPLIWLWGCSGVIVRDNQIIGDRIGHIEVVDFDAGLLTNGIIQADPNWAVIKGEMRKGSK